MLRFSATQQHQGFARLSTALSVLLGVAIQVLARPSPNQRTPPGNSDSTVVGYVCSADLITTSKGRADSVVVNVIQIASHRNADSW